MQYRYGFYFLLSIWVFSVFPCFGQNFPYRGTMPSTPSFARVYDSIAASHVPVLYAPVSKLKRSLPASVDNSENDFWPGLLDQFQFYSCQQYSGVAYTFGYEFSRLKNTTGWNWENRFPAHHTWNFLNEGGRYVGVNFLHSFDVIRQQGHMTNLFFGEDTTGSFLGWKSGYDSYYSGMFNRLKQVYAIPVNSETGINTLRNYLYDHLDGSSTGGVACFTTDSWFNMHPLPSGTPEAGKSVQLRWLPNPDHGLCIVGYNDSIRYDLNNDGAYTNDIDINADGMVDAKDWEIGGFKFANSWGYWWENEGCAYVLYSAMACNFEAGGVWNNSVFIVQPDTGYRPLLTVKVKIDYNKRQRIRLLAGISADTLSFFPEHTMSFPVVNFQGGDNVMSGFPDDPESGAVELGIDITPLINWFPASGMARLFLGVEEHDPDHTGSGTVGQASFISYMDEPREYIATTTPVSILDNDLTLVSAIATVNPPRVEITTTELPPVVPGQPYQTWLEASGGSLPYTWSLHETYSKQSFNSPFPTDIGTALDQISEFRPFAARALPFSFPFYGKMYDSIYINFYGFVSFSPQAIPAPYITDETAMMRMFSMISPAFSPSYTYVPSKNDGVFFYTDTTVVVIRWKTSVQDNANNSNNNFALYLYPDGHFEFRYGLINTGPVLPSVYTGISKGDSHNFDIKTEWRADNLDGSAIRYLSMPFPAGLELSPDGLLKLDGADPAQIFSIPVMVTDEENMTGSKWLTLSNDLQLTWKVVSGLDGHLISGQPSNLTLTLKNTGHTALPDAMITLRSMDTSCLVTDSIISIPALPPGHQATFNKVFIFTVTGPLSCEYPVRFAIDVKAGARYWHHLLEVPVAAPKLEFLSPQVPDGHNNRLDPGEIADLIVRLNNLGNMGVENVHVLLESFDTLVQVQSDPVQRIGQVHPLSQQVTGFRLQASRNAPPGHIVPFRLTAFYDTLVLHRLNFSLPVGKKAVAIINLSSANTSMVAMQKAMDSLGVGYDSLRALNTPLSNYERIFLILGHSTQGAHSINSAEAKLLSQYLEEHGNLYMEGYFTWYYTNNTVLHPYFKYTTDNCPLYSFEKAIGVPGTLTDAMSFDNSGYPDFCLFTFVPQEPAYTTFVNTSSPARNLEIVYPGPGYKTIGTFLEFGSLTGSVEPSTLQALMQRYLEFFDINLSGPYVLFHADKTTVKPGFPVVFTDDSYDDILSWQWEFPGGDPATSNEANPTVMYNASGAFDVKLTVSNGVQARSLVRKNYIVVNFPAGMDKSDNLPRLSVYPNPAKDQAIVVWSGPMHGNGTLSLINLMGQTVMEKGIDGWTFQNQRALNLSGLAPGIYFVKLRTQSGIAVEKLMVN